MRIPVTGRLASFHEDDQHCIVFRRLQIPEAGLACFVGNTEATNKVPRNSNFIRGITPVRLDNAAILNSWVAISKTRETERFSQVSTILSGQIS